MTEGEPDARGQSRWLLGFLAIALAICAATDLAARNRTLERWMTGESSRLSTINGKLFSNNGSFVDYEERVLLDEWPNTDFARGRVYFFGSSNTKWAFTTWDLPDAQRQRIGNYGTGGAAHRTIYRLVRYVGERGMFATGTRSEVVIGVSYHLGHAETPDSYFPALVRRQGIYAIGPDDRLTDTGINPLDRFLRIEKARGGGFVRNIGRLANNAVLAGLHLSRQPPHDPAFYGRTWRMFMGPDWQPTVDHELGYLRATISLLRAHHVPVKIAMLPQGTWMTALPFGSYYDQRVREIARATATPLVDWSKTLPDSDFIDSNHLTEAGQTKFRAMMLAEEGDRLRWPRGR